MNPQIPQWPFRLLHWFCDPEIVEDIEGDLVERYERQYKQKKFSNWRLVRDVLLLFRPGIIRSIMSSQNHNYTGILRYHFIFAIRNFSRQKLAFLINVIGLASGMTCAFLIYLWVDDELQVDKHFADDALIYQIKMNDPNGNTINTGDYTPHPMAQSLADEVSDIDQAIALIPSVLIKDFLGDFNLATEKKDINASGQFSEEAFFEIFSHELLAGNAADVLSKPNSLVISESLANKLFGNYEVAIGESVTWKLASFNGEALITGVFKDVPSNMTSQFDFVLDFQAWYDIASKMNLDVSNWGNHTPFTYVKLREEVTVASFNQNLEAFTKSKTKIADKQLLPVRYSSLYLYGQFKDGLQLPGRVKQVNLFAIIGLLIVIIAAINFMNLSTARASKRMKEIGIKKSLGIRRRSLANQFLVESILIVFIATAVSLLLVYALLPSFSLFTEKVLSLDVDLTLGLKLLGLVFGIGLLAGGYPALYLSGLDTIAILKNKLTSSLGELWLRKGLVVFQFLITTLLISAAVIIYQQINYMQSKSLGYDGEKVIFFPSTENISQQKSAFYSEITQIPGVVEVSGMSGNLSGVYSATSDFSWEGKDPDFKMDFTQIQGDFRLAETLNLNLLEGRTFSKEYNEKNNIIFNETAIKIMGLKDPVGQSIKLWGMNYQIVGVVQDFHYESLYEAIKPAALMIDYSTLYRIMVKLEGENQMKTVAQIEGLYQDFNPGTNFDFQFLNEEYQRLYASERRISQLSRWFSALAIVISCLGLLGLVIFTVQNQYKEIGIRKLFGLTTSGVTILLSKNFIKLILVAMLIALPVGYWMAKEWLGQFAYHVDLEVWMFGLAGLLSLTIAAITIGSQAFRVAQMNPIEAIKYE